MKEGYIKTDFGIIPGDWKIKRLGSLGNTYSGLSGKTKEDFGKGKPYITYMNIYSNPRLNNSFCDLVEVGVNENQNSAKYGDIFFTTSSETPDEVGLSSVLLKKVNELYLNSFCFGFRLNDFESLLPEYAVYVLRGEHTRKTISILAQGSTRFNLSKITLLKRLYLALPPLPEQQKIAEILSTVDEKIEAIDQRIAETQELKKGLMQQLLTKGIGHTKFKDSPLGEIPESWEVSKLGKIAEIKMGQSPSSLTYNENSEGEFLIQGNADIKYRKTTPRFWTSQPTKLCEFGDIIMTVRAPVGAIAKSEHRACIGRGVCAIRTKKADMEFLYQSLVNYESSWGSISQGSTFTAVNGNEIRNVLISVPPLPEQKKISEILSSVDDKLQIQQDKKNEYQELKKGLMQQLLTGKVRVKV